jgi:hypothetical protein
MPDLPWFFGLFENFKSLQQSIPLPFPVPHLSHWPSVRIFNSSRPGNAYSPMKFVGGCKDNSRKTRFF